jgi:hypothetical protein
VRVDKAEENNKRIDSEAINHLCDVGWGLQIECAIKDKHNYPQCRQNERSKQQHKEKENDIQPNRKDKRIHKIRNIRK